MYQWMMGNDGDNFVMCEQNHLCFNVAKTKELAVDMRTTKTPVTKLKDQSRLYFSICWTMLTMFHECVVASAPLCSVVGRGIRLRELCHWTEGGCRA